MQRVHARKRERERQREHTHKHTPTHLTQPAAQAACVPRPLHVGSAASSATLLHPRPAHNRGSRVIRSAMIYQHQASGIDTDAYTQHTSSCRSHHKNAALLTCRGPPLPPAACDDCCCWCCCCLTYSRCCLYACSPDWASCGLCEVCVNLRLSEKQGHSQGCEGKAGNTHTKHNTPAGALSQKIQGVSACGWDGWQAQEREGPCASSDAAGAVCGRTHMRWKGVCESGGGSGGA